MTQSRQSSVPGVRIIERMIWAARSRASFRLATAVPYRSISVPSALEQWKYIWTIHASFRKRLGTANQYHPKHSRNIRAEPGKGIYGDWSAPSPLLVSSQGGVDQLDGIPTAWNNPGRKVRE